MTSAPAERRTPRKLFLATAITTLVAVAASLAGISVPAHAADTGGTGSPVSQSDAGRTATITHSTFHAGDTITIHGEGFLGKDGKGGVHPAIKLDDGNPQDMPIYGGPDAVKPSDARGYPVFSTHDNGTFDGTVTLPDAIDAGDHYLRVLVGTFGNKAEPFTAELHFTVQEKSTEPAATPPAVTTQPTDQTVTVGDTATFTAAASGTPTPTVQWQSKTGDGDWAAVPGATDAKLTVKDAALAASGTKYRAVFTNEAGSVTTAEVTLTVKRPAPAITIDDTAYAPGAVIAITGKNFIGKNGKGGVHVAAKLDDMCVKNAVEYGGPDAVKPSDAKNCPVWSSHDDGSFTGTLTVPENIELKGDGDADHPDAHWLRFLAGTFGNKSDPVSEQVFFTVKPATAPTVTAQPQDVSVVAGDKAVFQATATGVPTPTVQWQSKAPNGDWADISGATSTKLEVGDSKLDASGTQYRAVFTNVGGTATTNPAKLTVTSKIVPTVEIDASTYQPGGTIKVHGKGFIGTNGKGGVHVAAKLDDSCTSPVEYGGSDAVKPSDARGCPVWSSHDDGTFEGTATIPADLKLLGPGDADHPNAHWFTFLAGTVGNKISPFSDKKFFNLSLTCTGQQISVTTDGDGQTANACVQREVSSADGSTIEIRGTGWKTKDGKSGAHVYLKLASRVTPSSNDFQFVHTGSAGDEVLQKPDGSKDPSIWAVVTADADGNFVTSIRVPQRANVPSNVGDDDGALRAGRKLVVHFQTGLNAADASHSVDSASLVVDGTAYSGDKDAPTMACTQPAGRAEAHFVAENGQKLDPVTGPRKNYGDTITLEGTGWCASKTDPSAGGSVIGLKIDEGKYSHRAGELVNANPTTWFVIKVNSNDGSFKVDIPIPAAGDTKGGSTPAFVDGAHTMRLLSGSLKKGDTVRTFQTGPFTVGEYRPTTVPDPVEAHEDLTGASAHGVTAVLEKDDVLVTIPGATAGQWAFLSSYLADGSVRYPWADRWFQTDANGQIRAPLAGASLPTGTWKLAVQDPTSAVTGWANITIPGGETASAPAPSATATAKTGGSQAVSKPVAAKNVQVQKPAPTTIPAPPVNSSDDLNDSNAGGVIGEQNGTVLTLTLPEGINPGDWVFLYVYPSKTPVGWVQVDNNRKVAVDLGQMPDGLHKVTVQREDASMIGWAPATIGNPKSTITQSQSSNTTSSVQDTGHASHWWNSLNAWLIASAALLLLVVLLIIFIIRRRRAM